MKGQQLEKVSPVGGQGMIKCNFKGECTKKFCACKKAGRSCTSKCHRNNSKCKNHEEEIEVTNQALEE